MPPCAAPNKRVPHVQVAGMPAKKNPHVATAERKQELMVQLIECSWCVLSRSCFAHRLAVDTTKVSLAYEVLLF